MDSLEDAEAPKRDSEHQTNSKGDEGRAGSVILTDPDILNCPVCFESLTAPVFQCDNGHITCCACRIKLENKCSTCNVFMGSNRCRAIERVIESAKVLCPYSNYGCKEKISFSKTRNHRLIDCLRAPCSCPISDCNYVGLSRQLHKHFKKKHKGSAVQFLFNKVFHITLNDNDKSLILQEEKDGYLFILHNCTTQPLWNLISVSCIASRGEEVMYYDLLAKDEWRSSIKFQSNAYNCQNKNELELEDSDPKTYGLLPVPYYFIGSDKQLELDICICGPGIRPDKNKI